MKKPIADMTIDELRAELWRLRRVASDLVHEIEAGEHWQGHAVACDRVKALVR